jgi:uncharacterized repeat protein (TIGR03843 family)
MTESDSDRADPAAVDAGSIDVSGVDLVGGELTLAGRIRTASNATFLGSIGGVAVVYKPVAGERPLWDFPDGTLAGREAAAYLVSESFGWNIVPRTWLREGPLGLGMVQLWQEIDPEQDPVDLVLADQVPDEGWRQVLEGADEEDRTVALIHEDSTALRRMAVFDIVVNNADRKGAHVLPMPDGHRHGVDHGLTFHIEHKLRTVLWGWLGEELTAEELEGIERVSSRIGGDLGRALAGLLSDVEIAALAERCERLRSAGRFPAPSGRMPAVPWPLF